MKGVAESGVRTAADAGACAPRGAANLLVGEALVRAADPGALLREMTAPVSRVRVKICGITRLEDALAGGPASAPTRSGFNFWPGSKRHVAASGGPRIVARLPPFVTAVGVFVNQPPTEVLRPSPPRPASGAVQLHGDEPPRRRAAATRSRS